MFEEDPLTLVARAGFEPATQDLNLRPLGYESADARCRFPPMPITDGTVDRLERENVELAFHDIEDLFADGVHARRHQTPVR